jgi:hypothetical protein
MPVTITVSPDDVAAATNFLESFLSSEVPQGDFTAGTALHDLCVSAIASVVAFFQADAAQIRQMQSLTSVQAATGGDPEALSDAVTAILSNFLLSPNSGTFARGFAIGHSSQQVDVIIAPSITFTFSPGVIFVTDNGGDTFLVQASELTPVTDATGNVLDYEFRIPMVAVATGTSYNVQPGLFATWDRFNPYITRVEVTTAFSGGAGQESTTDFLAQAPTAISVRNLINSRSIEATLESNFADIETVLVVGMGDPEMQRDIVPTVAPHLQFHVGGCVDIYVRTGLTETSFTGTVGGLFTRPDGVAAILRDPDSNFLTAGVTPGMIVNVVGGLPNVPSQYLVEEVINANTLAINETAPFPVATDQAVPPTTISYTIGQVAPNFVDVLANAGGQPVTTGITSAQISLSGRITLPGGPVMDIIDVAIINPQASESLFESTLDGFVHFPNQVNATPMQAQTPAEGLQFQTVSHNTDYNQSNLQWLDVVVGTDTFQSRFDGYNCRVRYNTIADFNSIDAFVRGTDERVSAAFQLPKGHNPVTVSLVLAYTLSASATATLDDSAVSQTIIDYINSFDATDGSIDVSTIIQLVRNAYPTISGIVPQFTGTPILTIEYTLRAPTGDVLTFSTNDVVLLDSSYQTGGPSPPTWEFMGEPVTLTSLGVTTRTIRFVANTSTITVVQQGA